MEKKLFNMVLFSSTFASGRDDMLRTKNCLYVYKISFIAEGRPYNVHVT